MKRMEQILDGTWKFLIDPKNVGEQEEWYGQGMPEAKNVHIPHTWNVEPKTVDYRGIAWYKYEFEGKEEWNQKRICFQFNGVYRDAKFWLNGKQLGSHLSSGFTTFIIEAEGVVIVNGQNSLVIQVDNRPSREALPCERSFDWADDGGIIRNVKMIVTESCFVNFTKVHAIPQIDRLGEHIFTSDATFSMDVSIYSKVISPSNLSYKLTIYKGIDEKKEPVASDTQSFLTTPTVSSTVSLLLSQVDLWHFDHPRLYTAILKLYLNGEETDEVETRFGFRVFQIEGSKFVFNGEYVRLCGTEWMPGSHPLYGNAEQVEIIEKTLLQLKETNCVLTRFHWQQDDALYDWCDKHGMLVQEEIPHWGIVDEFDPEKLFSISKQQIDEMIASHYNHPSIIMWGIGNELNGQDSITQSFLQKLKEYVKHIDRIRPVNYVTNTIYENPANDAARVGDVIMINDYIGTWHGDLNLQEELEKIRTQNQERAIIIAEFGLCEPAFTGGDRKRSKIFTEKMDLYRRFPEIAGTINFCLNDYRTQMGEDGKYQFRRRVHGSTDLFGETKPSYFVVQEYCAPVTMEIYPKDIGEIDRLYGLETEEEIGFTISLYVKDTLPSYTISGYRLVSFAQEEKIHNISIPHLAPGKQWKVDVSSMTDQIQIQRWDGAVVLNKYL